MLQQINQERNNYLCCYRVNFIKSEIKNPKITLVKKTGVKVGDLVQIYTDTHKDKTYEGQQRFYFINRTTGFTMRATRPDIESFTTKIRTEIASDITIPTEQKTEPETNFDL